MNKFIGIISARYSSTRFPGKPLAKIDGKSIIEMVYKNVADILDEVIVATDDERIFNEVKSFNGNVVMTSANHQSGTDRCYEAFLNSNSDATVIINIQGDEPFIDPKQIELLKSCFNDNKTDIATLVKPFNESDNYETLSNPNSPKVVIDNNNNALYFSRSVIPYLRNFPKEEWCKKHTFYKHIGIYAYKSDILKRITVLPQSELELAESLEQLRWISNSFNIKVGITDIETIGIDTPEDLQKAIEFYNLKTKINE